MTDTLAIIPTYISKEADFDLAVATVETLHKTAPDVNILVVDDYSPDPKYMHRLYDRVGPTAEIITKDENTGFSSTVNIGLKRARENGQDALLVNADVQFPEEGWYEAMKARDEAVVGALLLYPNGLIQHAGVYYSLISRYFDHRFRYGPGNLAYAQEPAICPVTAALQLIKHECLENIGIYDEEFKMGWEDVDYQIEVFLSGRKCVYEPKARAIHHESMFRGDPTPKIRAWSKHSFDYLHKKRADIDFTDFVPHMLFADET